MWRAGVVNARFPDSRGLQERGPADGWRNFYYATDPIGGSVAGGLPEPVQEQVDIEFLDPADCYYVYGQAPPASKGHSGYWADPRVWKRINALAASGKGIPPARSVAEPTLAWDGEGTGR